MRMLRGFKGCFIASLFAAAAANFAIFLLVAETTPKGYSLKIADNIGQNGISTGDIYGIAISLTLFIIPFIVAYIASFSVNGFLGFKEYAEKKFNEFDAGLEDLSTAKAGYLTKNKIPNDRVLFAFSIFKKLMSEDYLQAKTIFFENNLKNDDRYNEDIIHHKYYFLEASDIKSLRSLLAFFFILFTFLTLVIFFRYLFVPTNFSFLILEIGLLVFTYAIILSSTYRLVLNYKERLSHTENCHERIDSAFNEIKDYVKSVKFIPAGGQDEINK